MDPHLLKRITRAGNRISRAVAFSDKQDRTMAFYKPLLDRFRNVPGSRYDRLAKRYRRELCRLDAEAEAMLFLSKVQYDM